ncbi:MAG: hypothetical protein U1F63_12530 [Chitinivorax sp.]
MRLLQSPLPHRLLVMAWLMPIPSVLLRLLLLLLLLLPQLPHITLPL